MLPDGACRLWEQTMDPAPAYPVTREQLLEWYRMMFLIRRFEELAAKAYTIKKILGFCAVSSG